MRTAAILPVKRFSLAKQRLGASVADPLRLQLAQAMVADVLAALAQTASIEQTIVITRETSVAERAASQGAMVVEDEPEEGQSAAVMLGVRRAMSEGIERVLCVPGDCPAIDPAELDRLLAPDRGDRGEAPSTGTQALRQPGPHAHAHAHAHAHVVIVPDRHGTGTNGLLLCPPDAIAPSFGADSCERHRALARTAGVDARLERLPSLLLDIDTGADLAVLRDRLAGATALAVRTRAVLAASEQTDVLPLSSTA